MPDLPPATAPEDRTHPAPGGTSPAGGVLTAPDAPAGIRPEGRAYVVAPVFGVRVAGLPVAAVESLRAPRAWAAADRLAQDAARLAADGARLADTLHDAIADPSRAPVKPLLVALRRSLFTGRRPTARSLAPEVLATLPDGLARGIRGWDERRLAHTEETAALPALLAAETRAADGAIAAAASAPDFRRALALSSPTLSADLADWLAGPGRPADRKARLSLARYVARAAAKTSPYVSFAYSGFGRWTAAGPAVRTADDLSWRSVVELDRAQTTRLWAALVRCPAVRDRARLRVNPTASDDGMRVWFLAAGTAERLAGVPSTGSVRHVLAEVRGTPGLTLAGLRQRLGGGAGTARGLEALIDAGLLELLPPHGDQCPDPLAALDTWLAGTLPPDEPERPALLASVRRIRAALPPGGTPDTAPAAARAALETTFTELTGAPPRLPEKNLCLETAVLPGTAAHAALPDWTPVLDDLDAVRRLLSVFDLELPVKLAAAADFAARYGPDAVVPALAFYRAVHADGQDAAPELAGGLRALLHNPLVPHPRTLLTSPVARMRELGAVRKEVWSLLGAGPDARPAPVRVDPDLPARLSAGRPPWIRALDSVCAYVQPVTGPDGLRVVLNAMTAGHGRGLGRLHHLVGLAGGEVPEPDGLRAPPGPELRAEYRGELASALNLRPPTTDAALAYPFGAGPGTGGAPEPPPLSPADLTVTTDPATGLLTLRAPDGRPVRPLHLGLVAEHWLPPALRFLVRVFGDPSTVMPPGWLFRAGARVPDAGVVERWPRLDVGRVTLARACWRLRAGDFPVPARGESQAAHLVRFAGWLRDHGAPARFFARVVDPSVTLDEGMRDGMRDGLVGKARKPFWTDAASPPLLAGLVRAVTAAPPGALVVLEEALPDPADAPHHAHHGPRVTEYLVQLSAVRDDR
ncbi:lantibiotic dehydratase [Streptomyces sp. RFCAC02]|uniref:lantibiotic dehydratase n=1 Tax=Streptomyces sp. RFCAC02 TaxID=2499143 RepID=UPI0010222C56|nr:lantibiotic dehydratase [Streptomyces sp. RFCAC02]